MAITRQRARELHRLHKLVFLPDGQSCTIAGVAKSQTRALVRFADGHQRWTAFTAINERKP